MSEDAVVQKNITVLSIQKHCKTQEKKRLEESQKGWSWAYGVCVCVYVCVHNPTPGDSQACNYTLVGEKLIKASWGEWGQERCTVKADNAQPYQTQGFSITPLGFIIIIIITPFFGVIIQDPPTHHRTPLGEHPSNAAHGASRLTAIIQLEAPCHCWPHKPPPAPPLDYFVHVKAIICLSVG